MATRTKKRTRSTKKTQTPAVRDKQPVPSATDMLAGLADKTKTTKKSEKAARPVLTLPQEVQDVLRSLAPMLELADRFTTQATALKDEVKEGCMSAILDTFWAAKTQPKNPSLAVNTNGKPDVEGTYVLTSRFKVQGETADELVGLLVDLGVDEENAEALVENEVDFTSQIQIRPFNELVNASDAEEAVAMKLMSFVQGNEAEPLDDKERELVLVSKTKITVREGFMNRVCGYLGTKDELVAVFSAIQPVEQLRGINFGVSDSIEIRHRRLLEAASTVIGND